MLAVTIAAIGPSLPPPVTLYVYEGFNYTGDLIPARGGAGQGSGLGWDGPWASINRDPDCSHALPSLGEIWAPNHKQIVAIDILGVTDPDGDSVSITITKILQDEPTNTLGHGTTWIEGGGIGTARAWVRAERSGTPRVPGNGRVYEIFFTVSDGKGGTCSSSVKVGH